MTEISEAAKAKACELMNSAYAAEGGGTDLWTRPTDDGHHAVLAFARFIQQVSDAAKGCCQWFELPALNTRLAPFILPEPVDPLKPLGIATSIPTIDPVWSAGWNSCLEEVRKQIEDRGLQILPVQS